IELSIFFVWPQRKWTKRKGLAHFDFSQCKRNAQNTLNLNETIQNISNIAFKVVLSAGNEGYRCL
ncbi:MAG: hypothetical protein KKF06_02410, partial [Candidatus Margulisbacteria bacterium]|nr:hypothetical protein [Candidatus Margulisiibacteriota bacterium]